ncbi:hypothetical protein D3C86_2218450 [compost metagenome]
MINTQMSPEDLMNEALASIDPESFTVSLDMTKKTDEQLQKLIYFAGRLIDAADSELSSRA